MHVPSLRPTLPTRLMRIGALAACVAAPAGCARAKAEKPHHDDARKTEVVVRYGDHVLSMAEVDAPIAFDLFELRSDTARRLTLAGLLRDEANRRGISVEELRRREVDDKATPPSEDTLRSLYAAETAQAKGAAPSYEELKPKLVDMAEAGERQALQQRFLDQLMDRAKVHMNFDALGRPKTSTRAGGPSAGPETAPITIVEYTDFESPFCAKAEPTVERLLREYPTQVRILFRQNPAPEHSSAELAGVAALCADEQGRYFDYRRELFAEQSNLGAEAFNRIARRVGLDESRFSRCIGSGEKLGIVRSDAAEARTRGLEGSPVFTVNGARLSGAHAFDTFKQLITLELR